MTNQEFADKVNSRYSNANKLLIDAGIYKSKINRGTAHTVAGYLEDVFAVYAAEIIENPEAQFEVDSSFFVELPTQQKVKNFRPDLAIIENGIMTHYFDMKTNLGFNRDIKTYLEEKNDFIENIKGQQLYKSDLRLAHDLKYEMVIFNGWNVSKSQVQKNIETANALSNVEMYILRQAINPRETENDDAEFDRLKKSIKRNK